MKKYDFKNIFLNLINRFINLFNLNINVLNNTIIQKKKINRINNLSELYLHLKKTIKKFPDNPLVQLKFTEYLFRNMDLNWIQESRIYLKKRDEFYQKNKINHLNIEFMGSENITGSLGNFWQIKNILDANYLKLRKNKQIIILKEQYLNYSNATLALYFESKINIVKNNELIKIFFDLQDYLSIPSGFLVPLEKKIIFHEFLPSYINQKFKNISKQTNSFKLSDSDEDKGKKILNRMGVPSNKWIVTFHIREVGFRNESKSNTTENFRNSNPFNYLKAMKLIISKGGFVIRMGDKSMTNLPKMKNFIDYANSKFKSDFMDVYLAAKSKFCVGTPSGYYAIPDYFGVPVVLTNAAMLTQYFSLKKGDIFLPRMIKKNNKYLNLDSMFCHPNIWLYSDKLYEKYGISTIENTEEQIFKATEEMIEQVFDNQQETREQNNFKNFISRRISNISKENLLPAANISNFFLKKDNKY